MAFAKKEFDENKPFAHMFYFRLSDTSHDLVQDFIDVCVKYLSHHEGQQHFSIGSRALDMERPVNAKNFDVAIHMVFKDFAAYDAYAKSDGHNEFITHSAGMSADRIVYDSFVQLTVDPV